MEGFTTPPALKLVIEQASRYSITLNGKPLNLSIDWWPDRKFEVLESDDAVVAGRNDLTLTTNHFSAHHEIKPVYFLGDFSLVSIDKGWKINPPQPLEYGSWKALGLPFYHTTVRYDYTVTVL